MLSRLFNAPMKLPLPVHVGGLLISFGWFQWIKGRLDASYAASNHPVDYATGQTAFDGPTIKGYYQTMIDAGTLDIYWQTQLIDFGFILGLFLMGLFAGTLIARFAKAGGWARRVALIAGGSIMFGALCDAIENLISFVMLSNPTDFADWIALPYSTFAVVKFICIAAGMFGLIGAVLLLIVEKIRGPVATA